jgi:hypothetical protein
MGKFINSILILPRKKGKDYENSLVSFGSVRQRKEAQRDEFEFEKVEPNPGEHEGEEDEKDFTLRIHHLILMLFCVFW